jgi:hypothetical protein
MKKLKVPMEKLIKICPSKKMKKEIKPLKKKKIKEMIQCQSISKINLVMLNRNLIRKKFRKKIFHQNKNILKSKI